MYIITGLGRCGTSILTKYISKYYNIGYNVNWHENVRAGLELTTFYSLIHDLYHRFCKIGEPIDLDVECWGDYWKPLTYREALIRVDKDQRQYIDDRPVYIVKDPRLTWHPDLIQAVWEARCGDIKLIICHREVESIKRSRESLPEAYGDPKPRKELSEYKIDFANFIERVWKLNIPHINLFFPNFLKDTNYTWVKLNNFGLTKLGCDLNELVDRNLINGT